MKIYIGADHNGFHMRNALLKYLESAGYEVEDEGDARLDPNDDYPVLAGRVVAKLLGSEDRDPRGILLCGSGQGMCMAANRRKGIRAVLGYDRESIKSARHDDDANVLCLPASTLTKDSANLLVETFLNTPFGAAARYVRRIKELDEI